VTLHVAETIGVLDQIEEEVEQARIQVRAAVEHLGAAVELRSVVLDLAESTGPAARLEAFQSAATAAGPIVEARLQNAFTRLARALNPQGEQKP
jgi:hypothetical protein